MKYFLLSFLTLSFAANCSHTTKHEAPTRSVASMSVLNAPQGPVDTSFKQRAFRRANEIRQQHGLKPLRHNAKLAAAAQGHSAVMAKHGYLGHHQPRGGVSSSMKRAIKAGYSPSLVAENVFGPNLQMSAIDHAQLTPERAVQSWLESEGHRRNLLDKDVVEVGYGYVNGFWTQVLAAPDRYSAQSVSTPKPKKVGPAVKPAPKAFAYRNL